MKRRWVSGFVIGFVLSLAIPVSTQAPFAIQIQTAIAQLTTGVTPFTQARITTSGYLNWGATSGTSGFGIRDNAGTLQFKASTGGTWLNFATSATLPTAASYWTRVPETDLSNETALSTLATALILNTTATGVPVAYAGTTCTNQFVRALSAVGAATCATVVFSTDTSGNVGVTRGGTNLASGTSGGVLAFTGSTTIASSGALTANAIVLGGGAGVVPTVMGSLGTTTTVLHGNASGAPTFAAVTTSDISGTWAIANGGTNSATALSGSTLMVSNGSAIVQGTAGTTTTLLHGNAAGTPTYSAVSLTADITGILAGANGGTGNGFLAFAGPAGTLKTYTGPNQSATLLTDAAAVTAAQGGTSFTSYTIGDLLTADTATTLAKIIDVAAGRFLRSAGAGVLPAYSTTVWTNAATTGDFLYASSANTYANLPAVATGQVIISKGVGVAPEWSSAVEVATVKVGTLLTFSNAVPTISSGFGTAPSVSGTATAFRLNVGTGGIATGGVIGLPATGTGWNCQILNLTALAANRADQRTVQTASTTTTATVQNQTISTGAALVWTASDILAGSCIGLN